MSDALRVLVVADFNATNVEVLLGKSVVPRIEALGTPLGNVYQTLLAPPGGRCGVRLDAPRGGDPELRRARGP